MHHPSATTRLLLIWATLAALSALHGASPIMIIAEAKARLARREVQTPVRVRGVVTFSNQRLGLAYVQDDSGGIGFDPRIQSHPLPEPGQTVEVEGMLCRRQGLAMVLHDRIQFGPPEVTIVSQEKKKTTPMRFDLDLAAQMRIDGLLSRVTGVIRRVSVPPIEGSPMLVEISSPSGYAIARLPWRESPETLQQWLNEPVSLTAVLVCRAEPPLLPEDADALLLVPSRSHWSLQDKALDEVFQRPPVTAASAIQATQRANVKQRMHIVGTVIAAKPNAWVCLRTDDGSIEVSTRQMSDFVPGQKLAVACWPQLEDGRMMLLDGVCRSLGMGPPPEPVHLEQGFFHPSRQRELVSISGILRNHSVPGGIPRLSLELPSGVSCLLHWEPFFRPEQVSSLEDGSQVQVTGLFHIQHGGTDSTGLRLSILPRTPEDLRVLAGPSWWNQERLTLAVWWLLGITGLAVPGALVFRWQVWRQARHIHAMESKAAAEEERLRIAREFHDSLQQQLTGAALHLETLKGALDAAPEMLPRLIDDTTAMLRHCQMEARHCIWDLRSETTVRESLRTALKDWVENRVPPPAQTRIEFYTEGPEPHLPEGSPFQLMRIAQEAVTNALTHAEAHHIRVSLRTSHSQLELVIEDDGCGFEDRLLRQPKPGHYGLSGIQERASKIGASLYITSRPGKGTRVCVRYSLFSLRHEACA
ncbi:Histidine kinase-, DNA gyrase B-, and HSP90-like ATPase [Prosthecobacter debontii]|uniref:Histidine kinase-, DNA gyrase B-, and HSP90-like ATPase n=1 Tax=Prosthecobacter debontii TaxID=48467 RepID=A0A1T4YIS4_9BACT|nr:sensor histidine kinase [Prosthecobacter debontii]SKB01699.1 Histidine kinase-, DNA gyrase B-, and HSP90-like ATPase [Prosthecobacter debontii]